MTDASEGQPKPNRMIVVTCDDYAGEFEVEGMFIPYRPGSPIKLRGKARFCVFDKDLNCWASRRELWKSRNSWRYAEEL